MLARLSLTEPAAVSHIVEEYVQVRVPTVWDSRIWGDLNQEDHFFLRWCEANSVRQRAPLLQVQILDDHSKLWMLTILSPSADNTFPTDEIAARQHFSPRNLLPYISPLEGQGQEQGQGHIYDVPEQYRQQGPLHLQGPQPPAQ